MGRSEQEAASTASIFSNLLLGFFISFSSLVLPGCLRRSPYGVADRYINNLQQFKYTKCYSLLSEQDRADRPLHQFLTEVPLAPDVSPIWFRPILHVMRFELGTEHRNPDGSSAYVPVRITAPNLALWERTLNANAGIEGSLSQLASRSLATGAYPTVTYEDKIFLVKENRHWRVLAGFTARDRVLERRRRAMLDFYKGQLDQAIAQFNMLVNKLEQLPGTGNLGLAGRMRAEAANMTKLRADSAALRAYSAKLELGQVAMRMALERVPAIFGEVTNAGDKPIDELGLAVTWYQGRDKNLKLVEREEHSVVVTPIEFTDFTRQVIPLLPGERRQFGFILSAAPEVQQEATPYVSVASLAFTEIPAPLPRLRAASNLEPSHLGGAQGVSSPATAASVSGVPLMPPTSSEASIPRQAAR
jgi:hypothetical protein